MTAQFKAFAYQMLLALALASGLFVALLGGLLIFNQTQGKVLKLVKSKELTNLHDDLRRQPKDEALKQRIRQLDLRLRQNTFYRLRLSHNSSRSLIAGLVVFLTCAHFARSLRKQLPNPVAWGPRGLDEERKSTRVARYAVAGVFLLIAGAALGFSLRSVQLPEESTLTAVETGPNFPTLDEMKQNWPAFRGWDGQGVARSATIPTAWDIKNGAGIKWKTAVPVAGLSSPVVWGDRLFLTGATTNENQVLCFDANSGALLWSSVVKVPGVAKPPAPKVADDTGYAASTPVTDGRRVYAIFADGQVAAFDFKGKQAWAKNLGPLESAYGYASSLAMYQDRLLIQLDQGHVDDARSRALALDTRTGRELWSVPRPVGGSWASPVVAEVNKQLQFITCANPWVIAYNPLDGTELWRAKKLEGDVAPSPIVADGLVVATAPNAGVMALRGDGKGDVTATNLVWETDEGVPDATSPVHDGQRIYLINSDGLLTCVNARTGKSLWMHELDARYYASPTIAGNVMILLDRKGRATLLEPGDQFKQIGTGDLGEECNASPVPIGQRLYIRGVKNLFCIEAGAKLAVQENAPK